MTPLWFWEILKCDMGVWAPAYEYSWNTWASDPAPEPIAWLRIG